MSVKAKDFLSKLSKLDRMITNKVCEKEKWRAIALGTTVKITERVQTSSSQQKMANAVVNYIDVEKDIDRCISKLADEKRDVINAIEQLEDTHYDVLHKIYVQDYTFQDIADSYDKSYSWATSVHGRALVELQDILDAGNYK